MTALMYEMRESRSRPGIIDGCLSFVPGQREESSSWCGTQRKSQVIWELRAGWEGRAVRKS